MECACELALPRWLSGDSHMDLLAQESDSWLVIATAGSIGIFGAIISFAHDRDRLFT